MILILIYIHISLSLFKGVRFRPLLFSTRMIRSKKVIQKYNHIYIDIVMSVIKAISMMSKNGYSDIELLEYIDKHYDEIEHELNGEEYITKG